MRLQSLPRHPSPFEPATIRGRETKLSETANSRRGKPEYRPGYFGMYSVRGVTKPRAFLFRSLLFLSPHFLKLVMPMICLQFFGTDRDLYLSRGDRLLPFINDWSTHQHATFSRMRVFANICLLLLPASFFSPIMLRSQTRGLADHAAAPRGTSRILSTISAYRSPDEFKPQFTAPPPSPFRLTIPTH